MTNRSLISLSLVLTFAWVGCTYDAAMTRRGTTNRLSNNGQASSYPSNTLSLNQLSADIMTVHRLPPLDQPVSPQPSAAMITLRQSDDLNQIISEFPAAILIDFYADWCGPCKKQSSVLNEVQGLGVSQSAAIVKINVDQHPQLAEQYQVSGLPTLVLVRNGQVVDRRTGFTDLPQLEKLLAQ